MPLQGDVCVPIGLVKYPGLPSGLFAASQSGKPAFSRYKVLARHTDRDSTLAEVSSGEPHCRVNCWTLGVVTDSRQLGFSTSMCGLG